MTNDPAGDARDDRDPAAAQSQMPGHRAASEDTDDLWAADASAATEPVPLTKDPGGSTRDDQSWPGSTQQPPWSPGQTGAPPWPPHPAQPGAPGTPGWPSPWAARYGLVRPLGGRWLAGVCAAFARATNTDPVLWRVLVAVLGLFWGVGVLAYVVAWLLIPAEGDTASPIEALFGRGRSRTKSVVTVLAGLGAIVASFGILSDGFQPAVLAALVVLGAAFLLTRRSAQRLAPSAGGSLPATPFTSASGAPPWTVPSTVPSTAPAPAAAFEAPVTTQLPGYGPPFAPHGPYADTPPYPPPPDYPPLGSPPGPPPIGPLTGVPAVPPRRERPRSRLGRLTLSVVALAMGVLAVVDLAGANVPASVYVGLALAIVGAGLVVGAWYGRARWLIAVGALLTVALAITAAGERWNDRPHQNVTWTPTSISDLHSPYRVEAGNGVLDLSKVDFTSSTDTHIDASARAGNLEIILPPRVDVDVSADVSFGNAHVFDNDWGGVGAQQHVFHDNGVDGAGGGQLSIAADVRLGNLEVHR